MSCACTRIKNVPACTNNLTLGTITDHNAAVWIYIEDLTTGRKKRVAGVSSNTGEVILAMDSQRFYQSGHAYEITVVLQSATSIYDTKDITVSGVAYSCFLAKFEVVSNDTFGWYPYENITVEIEE